MIQITIIIVFIALALFLSKEYVLLLTLLILPFHFLLKALLNKFGGGSDFFSSWKEIVLLILFLRIVYDIVDKKIGVNPRYPFLLVIIYFFCCSLLFLFADNKSDALISYKNFAFPLLCFFISSHIKFNKITESRFIKTLSIIAIFVFIIGHIQHIFFKYEFAVLMNLYDDVTSNGDLVFKQSAIKIMGKDRMYGCFVGPNELGLYTTTILIMVTVYLYSLRKSNKSKILFYILLIFGVSALLQTYSRVSWFISISTILLYFAITEKKIGTAISVVLSLSIVASAIIFFVPDASQIIEASASGKEASAQGRSEVFFSGLSKIIETPEGFGLGTIQYSSTQPRKMWTEIYWWLVIGETGILLGLFLFYIYLNCSYRLYSQKVKTNKFAHIMPLYLAVIVLAGFGSIIIFEPIFQVYLWCMIGLGYNKTLI